MNFNIYKQFAVLLLVLLFLAMTGCTHMINPPKEPYSQYPLQDKLNLKVGLSITDKLREAEWVKKSMGDKWVIPIGEYLVVNSEMLARHVFKNVILLKDLEKISSKDIEAVFTPKLVYINRTTGATSFGESIISVKVEWNLSSTDGRTIWIDTVGGESSGSTGWTNPEKILKRALEKMLENSQQRIMSSEVIQQYILDKAQ